MKKIVILGPESTGKSSLCEQLATHYNTIWVKEYAREYLHQHGINYQYEQLYEIAQGQLLAEDHAAQKMHQQKQASHLFIDTDMYVMKVWSEIVFNKCDNRILTHIAKRKYDLYLLCNTDLPWVEDDLREYPDLKQRQKIYQFYKDAMINQHVPWIEISGDYDLRFETATKAIETILTNHI